MRSLTPAIIVTCATVLALAACGGPSSEQTTVEPGPAATVPATLFAAAAPAGAMPLVEVKSAAKPGDRVVFEARVGGRRDPFVENRAVFFAADASLLTCDQLEGDTCRTPWDYCCEPGDTLLKHLATVRVVNDDGQPLKISLENEHGLAPLRTIVVSGTVDQSDESGNFVVNAEAIFVGEG